MSPRRTGASASARVAPRARPNPEHHPGSLSRGERRAAGKALLNRAAGMDRLDFHLDQELQHLVRSADSPRFAAGLDEFFARKGSPQGARSAG